MENDSRKDSLLMKILVVNGSPNGKKGNTNILQKAFVIGASEEGASVEEIFLNSKKIRPCLGCSACWVKTPGTCVQKDDQSEILEKIKWADTLVLATPLYVDGMTSQAKAFIDRLIPMGNPEFVLLDGHCRHPILGDRLTRFALISNCGFHELDNFDALIFHCRRMCLNLGSEYAGHLLRPHGPILAYADVMPEAVGKVLEAANQAGRELVRSGEISQSTMSAVSAELVTKEVYVEMVNSFFRNEKEKAASETCVFETA